MLLSDLKPGNIVYFSRKDSRPRFCPIQDNKIQNNLYWLECRLIEYQEPILFVEKLNLNSLTRTAAAAATATAAALSAGLTAPARGATAVAVATRPETMASVDRAVEVDADYTQAVSDWKKQKFISGGVFLADLALVWISHIDLKYFNLGKPKS